MEESNFAGLHIVYAVLNYIENNYDQAISIKQLEEVSHYSYRNIQRIFKYTCGETIGAYQKRLRVENAYKLLLYTSDSISSIALQVGFANLASFSKAFKQHFNCAPKDARAGKVQLFNEANIVPAASDSIPAPDIIYLPAVRVYYESAVIPYENNEIEGLWARFMRYEFPPADTIYYGVVADEPLITDVLSCRYDACASAPPRNKILPSKMILGARYARFVHNGTYETIEETYNSIYARWMLTADLEFAHTPVIERYLKHPDNTDAVAEQLTEILLPLK